MPSTHRYEQQFLDALKAIFIGADVKGKSGYINLMKIKRSYFEDGVFPQLQRDIDAACKPFEPSFREELFDKLYDFFRRYFSESGSIYFRHTAASEGIYERVYTDDRDVMLFWKTHMLYYVKTDRLFNSMEVAVDGERFYFDVAGMELKRANEKRELIYQFKRRDRDRRLVFAVAYSEKGRKTRVEDILRDIRQTGAPVDDETLERAFRVFEKQSEVDYFINKDAKAFLEEQFDLWMYQYVFRGDSAFSETRLRQLQAIKAIAYEIIGFIPRFEDELVAVWNKPKFALNSHYIVTLDKILDGDPGLLARLFVHAGMAGQMAEWHELGMLDEKTFGVAENPEGLLGMIQATDLTGAPLHPRLRYLPLDTKHVPGLELAILALFDDPSTGSGQGLDASLDRWLVHSENYQALNTLLPKFRERVKAIYIDPPYNTDAGPIDYVNDYRSSSWLSLMENRLKVSKQVLSDVGIICVTIDDYQVHELAKLLDGVFGRENQLGTLVIRNNPSGRSTVKGISICHEYAFFYQSSDSARLARLPRTEKQLERFAVEDGEHVNWQNFRKGGGAVTYRVERPKQYFPLYVNPQAKTLRVPSLSWNATAREWNILESPLAYEVVVWPIDERGKERVWSLNHESATTNMKDLEVRIGKDGSAQVYRRHKPTEGVLPRSWWDKNTYAAREHGSATLKNLFGEADTFSFAKSPLAVQDCIWVAGLDDDSDNLVLDYFAGSGTTAHAVMNLNRADGGSRKYILVEMGEHFNTVILPRVKKVAFSDKWKGGKAMLGNGSQGMSHFVKYFDLEQYEDTLRRARYDDHAAPLFAGTLEELARYVFLRDLKLLDAVSVDVPGNQVAVALDRLYPGIDLAETLSCLTGQWIRRITADTVEFADGSTANLAAPRWDDVKPLIWW